MGFPYPGKISSFPEEFFFPRKRPSSPPHQIVHWSTPERSRRRVADDHLNLFIVLTNRTRNLSNKTYGRLEKCIRWNEKCQSYLTLSCQVVLTSENDRNRATITCLYCIRRNCRVKREARKNNTGSSNKQTNVDEAFRLSRDGAVVRSLASYQCGLGSILARCHMWVEFTVSFRFAPWVFPPSSPVLLPPQTYPNCNSTGVEDPLRVISIYCILVKSN